MAETEVSKMVAIEKKCGLDMISYQDLPKSDCNGTNHHNQVNDLDKSYVFVNGSDGLPDGAVGDNDVCVGGFNVPPEPEGSQNVGAASEEAHHLNEGVNVNVELCNGDSNLVNCSTCKHDSSYEDGEGVQVSAMEIPFVQTCKNESYPVAEVKQVSVADSLGVLTEKTQTVAKADVKQVEDSKGETESMSEVEFEKAVDQNGETDGVVDCQREDFDGVTVPEPPLCPVENHESQVRGSELIEEIGENRESNNTFLSSSSSNSPNGGEDQSSTSAAEALEAQQRSHDVIVNLNEHELQSVRVVAEDEVKSNRELAEVTEHEVSSSTSLCSESFSIDSKDKTLEEEAAKIDLSLNVLENQLGDTAIGASNIVQDMGVELNELKSVGSSSDSQVQTRRDLASEVKNEDSSVSEVGNGTQYHEEFHEQPVGSSIHSQVQNTLDFVLEEINEDLFVCEVENCAQYHEKSQKQPVGSSSDSHVQTTSDFVLEDENEGSSVSEVENGGQYHDGSQEQPAGSSDSQVQTTCVLALEVKYEDSYVSEVENGGQFHEKSLSQPVVTSTDSHLQITHDLVVEKDEDSSVAEVEKVDQYHGESQEQPVVSSTDSRVQITCDLVLEEKDEDSSVSEDANGSEYPEEYQEQPDSCGPSHDTMRNEIMTEAFVPTLSNPAPNACASQSGTEVYEIMTEAFVPTQSNPAPNACASQSGTEVSDVEEIDRVSSPLVVGLESQIIEKVVRGHDSVIMCTPDEASSGTNCAVDMVPEKEMAFEGGDVAHSETEVSSGKSKDGDSTPKTLGVKLEPDSHFHDHYVRISREKSEDAAVTCRTDISDSFNHNLDGAANIELEADVVEDMGDKLDGAAGKSKENVFAQENENTGYSQNEETSLASAGVATTNRTDGEDESIKTKTKPFNFLIKTPRFDDDNLREQIRLAKLQVDEKTKLRDTIQHQIQEKRANSQINGIDYEFSKDEGRSARKLVREKRMEIDSLQYVINKAKNALSIEDIDSQIHKMEHMIQHETLPLKEEKQLIREIKQLKQLREQLSSNMGSQDEIKQALEQKEEIEERLKILRKELDTLKNKVLKAEATASEAEKKYDDENRKVKELQAQFRDADEVRQAAYAQWQNLRKELSKKSKYFFKYKDDAAVASNYAFSRDTEALYRLCTNQVRSFMEQWNTNPEFRRDYVKVNARSNIRRFGTLDCRSLGPDEEPPAKPSYADERGNRMASTPAEVDPVPRISSVEPKQKTPSENVTSDCKSIKKVTEPKNQKVPNGPATSIQVNSYADNGSDLNDEVHEEPIKSREEIESMRKAEEIKREKAEAKLKEQRRLEALEKANEARERKRRQAEKLQQRAELKTQKEAEQREKEREKRLRKKERKKAGTVDANDTNNNCETAPSSESAAENSKDIDVKEMPPAAAKKPRLVVKQSKSKSIPPPLRNRNKKKLQQWMWVGITSFIILVIFWLGNIGVFSNVALKRRAPVY